jgi:hypothetical protein
VELTTLEPLTRTLPGSYRPFARDRRSPKLASNFVAGEGSSPPPAPTSGGGYGIQANDA